MKRKPPQRRDPQIALGAWVELPESGDIGGRVVEWIRYIDGTERFAVSYWHAGKREVVNCERRELRVASQPKERGR